MRLGYHDSENRLIKVEPASPQPGSRKVQFEYDYLGRRVRKISSAYSSGAQQE